MKLIAPKYYKELSYFNYYLLSISNFNYEFIAYKKTSGSIHIEISFTGIGYDNTQLKAIKTIVEQK